MSFEQFNDHDNAGRPSMLVLIWLGTADPGSSDLAPSSEGIATAGLDEAAAEWQAEQALYHAVRFHEGTE